MGGKIFLPGLAELILVGSVSTGINAKKQKKAEEDASKEN